MTPEQMQELTSLRQYKQEIEAYVKRLEDLQDEHRKAITALRIGTDELMAALAERDDRIAYLEQCAGLARYDVNYVLCVDRGTVNQWD